MGDEGNNFFLTWTHQSGKKQRVDKCVKGVLLGQLGNFRDQFRRLNKSLSKEWASLSGRRATTLMYQSALKASF